MKEWWIKYNLFSKLGDCLPFTMLFRLRIQELLRPALLRKLSVRPLEHTVIQYHVQVVQKPRIDQPQLILPTVLLQVQLHLRQNILHPGELHLGVWLGVELSFVFYGVVGEDLLQFLQLAAGFCWDVGLDLREDEEQPASQVLHLVGQLHHYLDSLVHHPAVMQQRQQVLEFEGLMATGKFICSLFGGLQRISPWGLECSSWLVVDHSWCESLGFLL